MAVLDQVAAVWAQPLADASAEAFILSSVVTIAPRTALDDAMETVSLPSRRGLRSTHDGDGFFAIAPRTALDDAMAMNQIPRGRFDG